MLNIHLKNPQHQGKQPRICEERMAKLDEILYTSNLGTIPAILGHKIS